MFTAATISAPFAAWAATPPATASPPPDAANSRARRSMVLASTPICAATLSGACDRVLELDRGEPRLHEVGAERDDVLRGREVVMGHGRGAERQPVALTQRLERERLERDTPSTHGPHPFVHQVAEGPGLVSRDEHDPLPLRIRDLLRQQLDRLVPGRLRELPVGSPQPRAGDAVGVVEALEAGLAAGAQSAVVRRRVRVALGVDGAAFADPSPEAAARRAFATGGRVPRGDAG